MNYKSLRTTFAGLKIFFAVAHERSFTKAAARLDMSQTAVSHAMKALEASVGVQLLIRNSRTVSLTEAGEHLLENVAPQLEHIDEELAVLKDLRDSPTGKIRITASDHAVHAVLMKKLKRFLPKYPDIKIEVSTDNGMVDIVADRFDAGVRLGESLAQDMIAVRIGPDARFAAVATKSYLSNNPTPSHPHDLSAHNCINIRLPRHGNLWPWEFEKDGRVLNVRVDGQMVFNNTFDCLEAAIAGLGIAYIPEELADPYLRSGHLIRLLEDWCPVWPGLHLYYPSRRQPSGAMALLIGALKID